MSDTELRSSLKRSRRKTKLAGALITLCMILLVILFLFGKTLYGVLMLIPVIILSVYSMNVSAKIKNVISSEIVDGVVKEALDDAAYVAGGHLSDELISESYMVFPFTYDKTGGDDAVVGEYKGLRLKMSDVVLSCRVETDDGTENQKVFEGQWLVCDLGRELPGKVQLSQITKGMAKSIVNQRILTENEPFDSKFVVTANNPEEAFRILTPQLMDYCLALADRNKGGVYLSFLRDGKVHVAVNSGAEFFEFGKNKGEPEKLRQMFQEQLHWYTDIVDGLLSVLRL
jgi:hypothetical protein